MLDPFRITDSTTRDELIARITDLDDEIQQLETRVEDKAQEIEDLKLAPEQQKRLAEAADLMAGSGRIHDTPYAKKRWQEGK
jgi:hypothetical protein